MDLHRSDVEAVLAFTAEAEELDLPDTYSTALLTGLQDLVPSTWVAYQEVSHRTKDFVDFIAVGPDDGDDNSDVYFAVGPCPTQQHRGLTGDLEAVRTSDLIDVRRWHELPIYRDYFRPATVEYILDLGLSVGPDRIRSLLFMRTGSERNFSERDRAVLELLRPHFRNLERTAHLRALVQQCVCNVPHQDTSTGSDEFLGSSSLTRREREIVELVATGRTNVEIARAMWVAPSTVKKHLEHIYAKLGVRRRAAVVAARYAPASHGAADWS